MRHHRETYPATGIQEDFTLQYADDTKFLIHSRELIPEHGPHQLACRCNRCETERLNTIELPASFQYGQMRLNTNKSKYGEISATSVPESFKFVGSYLDPNEEINGRIMAVNKAYYRMNTVMNSQSGVSTKIKVRLYNSIAKPVQMFNLWTIPAKKEQRDRIDRTHRRQLRSVMGHYFKEDEPMVTCQEIYTVHRQIVCLFQ